MSPHRALSSRSPGELPGPSESCRLKSRYASRARSRGRPSAFLRAIVGETRTIDQIKEGWDRRSGMPAPYSEPEEPGYGRRALVGDDAGKALGLFDPSGDLAGRRQLSDQFLLLVHAHHFGV